MSDFGGILIACVALPLLAVVLLVAGVSYTAVAGVRLAGGLALEGLEFAGRSLAAGVRAATELLTSAGSLALEAVEQGAEWAKTLYDSSQVGHRLRATAQKLYEAALCPAGALGTNATLLPGTTGLGVTPVELGNCSATDLLARAEAARGALVAELPLRLVAERWHPDKLREASAATESARAALATGEIQVAAELAAHAQELYASIVGEAYQRLRHAERATIAAQVGNSLEDLGYQVRVTRVKETVAFVGRRGHHTVALVVRPGGRIELDMAGFDGDSCDRETKALLAALRRNGLVIASEHLVRHGRFAGGPLIRRAQRQGKPLEVALAECLDPLQQPEKAAAAPPRVRRAGALARGEAEDQRLQQGMALLWGQRQQVVN